MTMVLFEPSNSFWKDKYSGGRHAELFPSMKIMNPVTKNKILVKTALRYPKDHPAYKAAKKLLSRKKK